MGPGLSVRPLSRSLPFLRQRPRVRVPSSPPFKIKKLPIALHFRVGSAVLVCQVTEVSPSPFTLDSFFIEPLIPAIVVISARLTRPARRSCITRHKSRLKVGSRRTKNEFASIAQHTVGQMCVAR